MSKIITVNFWGGLLGFFNSPFRRLQTKLSEHVANGYRVHQVIPGQFGFLFELISLCVLVITFGIYQPRPGYIVVLEPASKTIIAPTT